MHSSTLLLLAANEMGQWMLCVWVIAFIYLYDTRSRKLMSQQLQ